MSEHHPDDPWDTPRSIMWGITLVGCGAASLLTGSYVPILSYAGAVALWPALVRVGRR